MITEIDELTLNALSQGNGSERFSGVLSNPPYQLATGSGEDGKKKFSLQIFPLFQEVANAVAPYTSMVYPANWQKDITKELAQHLLSHGLKLSDYYHGDVLFGAAIRKNFPISVVYTDERYDGPVFINGSPRDRKNKVWIGSDLHARLVEAVSGLPTLCGVTDLTDWSNIEDTGEEFFGSPAGLESPVSIYIKARPGKQADGGTYYVERSVLARRFPQLDVSRYKVATQSRIVGRLGLFIDCVVNGIGHIEAKVFGPDEMFGTTWTLMREFETKEEADNFTAYVNSLLVSELFYLDFSKKSFGSFVPDLEDYTNANPLFTDDNELPADHEYIGLSLNDRIAHSLGVESK